MNILKWFKIGVGFFILIVSTIGFFMKLISGVVWGGIVTTVLGYFARLTYKARKKK